jgi:twitching motility protein PilJ
VSGRDEIGSVANTLNASILQLKGLLGEQDLERQRGLKLQENVSEFLNVAMDIAGGDLTKKGAVTDDVLGNVVDAINIMTDEFGVLLGNVRSAAERVSLSANSMTQTSQGILENAQSQASLAQGAQNQTNLVAEAMQSLAMTADKGATAAQFTLEASSAGTLAVTQTREQLVQIRARMLEMTQGMQGLARRSDEINEVVRTISRFASQTNLLALGASLEAAGAGTAGARFGAVANAVRSLADDSAKAASRITAIVKDVQAEIQSLSTRAVSGAEQVQIGTQVAAQASERLERISDLAQQSAQVALDIASLATEQAESVETVRENVTRIVKTAQVTENNTRQGGVAAGELQTLSQSLSQSLERFRLPA